MLTLLASAARTASDTSGSLAAVLPHPEQLQSARVVLDVTAAGSAVGDTLDVYIQRAVGGQWDDVLHFTQVVGNGGAVKHIAEWFRGVTPESELHAPQDAAIAAGVVQGGLLGPDLRVKWVIANGGGTHSFTFSVGIEALRDR
jgi:hypothetical protein